jgi:hypothetical protein
MEVMTLKDEILEYLREAFLNADMNDMEFDGKPPRDKSGKVEAVEHKGTYEGKAGNKYTLTKYKSKSLIHDEKGNAVGEIFHHKDGENLHIGGAVTHRHHRGRGVMVGAYHHLATNGHSLVSDVTISRSESSMASSQEEKRCRCSWVR